MVRLFWRIPCDPRLYRAPIAGHSKSLGKTSHHTAQDYEKAVKTFVDLYFENEHPHPDDAREWLESGRWSERNARDLGEMADTVDHAMRYSEREGRLSKDYHGRQSILLE